MIQFDETPVLKASIKSIDIPKVNTYLARLGQSLLDDEDNAYLAHELSNLSILTNIDEKLHPSLGGILKFGKNPQKYFPSYNIMCGAYNGEDFLSDTIREKELNGTLDELIEDAIAFVKLTMPQTQKIERKIQSRTDYLYPVEAIREAIVNAVCHRDYTISGAAIRIFVYKSGLEIRSPGGCPIP